VHLGERLFIEAASSFSPSRFELPLCSSHLDTYGYSRDCWRARFWRLLCIPGLCLNLARRLSSSIFTISFRGSWRTPRRETSSRPENVSLPCREAIFACILLLMLTSSGDAGCRYSFVMRVNASNCSSRTVSDCFRRGAVLF